MSTQELFNEAELALAAYANLSTASLDGLLPVAWTPT